MLGIDSDYPADSIFYKKQFNIVPKKFQFIVKWSNLVPKKELSVNKDQFNAVKTLLQGIDCSSAVIQL